MGKNRMMGSIKEILNNLKLIVKEATSKGERSSEIFSEFKNQEETERLLECSGFTAPSPSGGNLSEWCLVFLSILGEHLSKSPDDAAPLLGALDEKTICEALRFIVEQELVPFLRGMLQSARLQESSPRIDSSHDASAPFPTAICFLLHVYRCKQLSSLVGKRHLVELLSSLILLAFKPNTEVFSTMHASPNAKALLSKLKMADQEGGGIPQQMFLSELHQLLDSADLTDVFKALAVVINTYKDRWFREACAEIQIQLIMRPNGLRTFFNLLPYRSGELSLDALDKVCENVLRGVPKTTPQGRYFQELGKQTLSILRSDHPASVALIRAFFRLRPKMAHRCILAPILQPLAFCLAGASSADDRPLPPAAADFNRAIEDLHKLLVLNHDVFPDLGPIFNIFPVLFALYVPTYEGIFHLKSKLRELLVEIARCLSDPCSTLLNILCSPVVSFDWTGEADLVPRPGISENDRYQTCLAMEHFLTLPPLKSFIPSFVTMLLKKLELSPSSEFSPSLMTVLPALVEKLTSHIEASTSGSEDHRVYFSAVRDILQRGAVPPADPEQLEALQESLGISVTMLLVMVSNKTLKPDDWRGLQNLLPLLRHLETIHRGNPELCQQLGALQVSIVTRGSAGSTPGGSSSSHTQPTHFQAILQKLTDPVMPVRGAAIKDLKDLVARKDPEVMPNKHLIYNIFKAALAEEESFLFLPAILGLATLVSLKELRDDMMAQLAEDYRSAAQGMENPLNTRARLGEVLVKVCQNLGDMTVKYRDVLLPVFLTVISKDADLRASSLSNLATVCRTLKFGLGPYLCEILVCVSGLLESDRNVEVRRAAAMVLTELLRGLDKDTFKIEEGLPLRILKILRKVPSIEKDDIVLLHAQQAKDELDDIVKSVLAPARKLEYKIRILDP